MNFNKIQTQTSFDNFPFDVENEKIDSLESNLDTQFVNSDLTSDFASSDETDVINRTRPYQKWKKVSFPEASEQKSAIKPIFNSNLNYSPSVSNPPKNDLSSTLLGRIKEGFIAVASKVFYVIKIIVSLAKLILLPPLKIVASLLFKIGKAIVKAGKGIYKSVGALLKGAAKCAVQAGKFLASCVIAVGKHPKIALFVVGVIALVAAIPTILKVGTAVGNVFATVFNVVMFVPNLLMGK